MYSSKIDPKFNKKQNPKIGLIALASDYIIEKDFLNLTHKHNIDLFVNQNSNRPPEPYLFSLDHLKLIKLHPRELVLFLIDHVNLFLAKSKKQYYQDQIIQDTKLMKTEIFLLP